MPAERVRLLVAEDFLGAAVEVDDALRLVDRDDRVGRDSEDSRELGFGGSKRLFDTNAGAKSRFVDEQSQKR